MAGTKIFHVFLSHNSHDMPAVRALGQALQQRGLSVWLDEWELIPGQSWQEALEEIVHTAQSAAVLVGKDGVGPWQDREMRACLSEFVNRAMPVIPVLLPGAPQKPTLPIFLKQFPWVDLRGGLTEEGLNRLVWGITGTNPAGHLAPVPSYTLRRPWLLPAIIALILFIGNVASNLVAEDLKEMLQPYRLIVWVIFFIAACFAVGAAIWDHRQRGEGHLTSPDQSHSSSQRDKGGHQSWLKALWVSGILLLIISSCIVYYVVTTPSHISECGGELNIPRAAHFAVKLHDGRVLIIGGALGGQRLTNTEIFDPAQSKFFPAGALNIGRSHHGSVLLRDGRVFVAGDNGHPKQAEIYDPAKNVFTLTQSTTVSQRNSWFSTTLLKDGRVLLVGSG